MTSAIKVQNEVAKLREEVMHSFRTYLPSKEFSTRMALALIWMHMLVKRIETSRDLSERRKPFRILPGVKISSSTGQEP